jgi:FKBP-type peptidyl-prolyl cis-trans isomerase FkpA
MNSIFKSVVLATAATSMIAITSCNSSSNISDVKLENENDSMYYALGVSVGASFQQMELNDMNYDLFLQGIKNRMDSTAAMEVEDAERFLQEAFRNMQEKKSGDNKSKNDEFLTSNKTQEGVMLTPSGVQYKVITPGSGEMPGPLDTVICHYKGTLIDGKEFDSSIGGEPAVMPLGRMIPGFKEGLMTMQAGGKYLMYIPAELGYGAQERGPIPGNSTLVFEIELFEIKKAK